MARFCPDLKLSGRLLGGGGAGDVLLLETWIPLDNFASPEKSGRRCIPWHQCVALHTGFLRVSHWSFPVTGRDSRVWGAYSILEQEEVKGL